MAQGREIFHKLSKTSENNIAVWKDFPARSPRCHLLVKLSLKPVANLPHQLLRLVGVCCYVDPCQVRAKLLVSIPFGVQDKADLMPGSTELFSAQEKPQLQGHVKARESGRRVQPS